MKRILSVIKKNYKFVLGIFVGLTIAGTGVYAAVASSSISYSNSASGLSSTNVQGAIDELATKADIRKSPNIVSVYTYNASTCVTGEETTCVKSTCHKSTAANSCKAGDIVKYKVNDTDIVTFHVMYDNGTTLTMQSQRNITYNSMWIDAADYATENTDSTSCSYTSCNDEGPITVLIALESATAGWTNVNKQTYTMGTTSLSSKGAYTGCSAYNSCTTNKYTLPSRTSKARMITLQEAASFGCTASQKSCPNWMNNYLSTSKNYGGTVNDTSSGPNNGSVNYGYWTMSTDSAHQNRSWYIGDSGKVSDSNTDYTGYGARAVVVVNK